MKVEFGKVKIREFDDTPSCPVIVNDVRVGDLKRGYIGPNEFSDWYMDSSSLGMIIPEHESAGWYRIAEAKRDVSKWIKKIPPKEIAERLVKGAWWSKSDREYKTLIKSNAMRIESNLVKTSKAASDIKKWLQPYKFRQSRGFSPGKWPVLEVALHFDNDGKSLFDDYGSNESEIEWLLALQSVDEQVRYVDEIFNRKPTRGLFKEKAKGMRDISKYLNGKASNLKLDLIYNTSIVYREDESKEVPGQMGRVLSMVKNAQALLTLIGKGK